MKKRIRYLISILTFTIFFLLCGNTSRAVVDTDKRVLFISSYSYGYDHAREELDGFLEKLDPQAIVDYEFMNTRVVNDPGSMELFYQTIQYDITHSEPYDVIVVADDAAFDFAIDNRDDLFENIPILFMGVNNIELGQEMSSKPDICGVLQFSDYAANISLGLKLNPNATKVYALLDDSFTGQTEGEKYRAVQAQFPNLQFEEINASNLSSTQLKIALHTVDKDSILIYVICTMDGSGKVYSDKEVISILAENSNVPTMRMSTLGVGEGLLGGYVVSMRESGKRVAEMANDILAGKDCSKLSLVSGDVNYYYIDSSVMKKYKLDDSCLPSDTIYVGEQVGFWDKYKPALIPCMIIGLILLAFLVVTLLNNNKNKKHLKELNKTRYMLEKASQHDFLTGLSNRSKFMDDLNKLIGSGRPCTVIMLDIDDFKNINDTYGHKSGDDALVQLANRLKDMKSQILTPYRLAGDEFVMILESSQSKIVEKTAYQCRQLFIDPFKINGMKMKVCGSIGIASYPKDAENSEQIVICADKAMYSVKKTGKNNFAYYRDDMENENGI